MPFKGYTKSLKLLKQQGKPRNRELAGFRLAHVDGVGYFVLIASIVICSPASVVSVCSDLELKVCGASSFHELRCARRCRSTFQRMSENRCGRLDLRMACSSAWTEAPRSVRLCRSGVFLDTLRSLAT